MSVSGVGTVASACRFLGTAHLCFKKSATTYVLYEQTLPNAWRELKYTIHDKSLKTVLPPISKRDRQDGRQDACVCGRQ